MIFFASKLPTLRDLISHLHAYNTLIHEIINMTMLSYWCIFILNNSRIGNNL